MRMTKKDWIIGGLNVLNNEGAHALMIDHMCAKMKITKGSFYHYYDGIDEYIFAMVNHWSKQSLLQLQGIEQASLQPNERLNQMMNFAFRHSGKTEIGLRRLTLMHRKVKTVFDKVEKKQLEILQQIFSDLGEARTNAKERALITHSGWAGILICNMGSKVEIEMSDWIMNSMEMN